MKQIAILEHTNGAIYKVSRIGEGRSKTGEISLPAKLHRWDGEQYHFVEEWSIQRGSGVTATRMNDSDIVTIAKSRASTYEEGNHTNFTIVRTQ